MKSKIFILLLISIVSFTLFSCDNSQTDSGNTDGCEYHMDDNRDDICDLCRKSLLNTDFSADGVYTLESYIVSNVDRTEIYYSNYFILDSGVASWVRTDLTGSSTEKGTYVKDDDIITITIGIKPYKFTYDETNKSIKYSGKLNKKNVVMEYSLNSSFIEGTDTGMVDFTDELFGEDINQNFYNYCPTIMMEGNDTMHIWYCSNKDTGYIKDYIAYRKGTLSSDGKWTFTEKVLVLSSEGSTSEWDNIHLCDPSVVKGVFNYNGETYNYLMSYLGCNNRNNGNNEIGLALAKNPEGPWIKYDANPFWNYLDSTEYEIQDAKGKPYWGYGQSSMISVDKAGKVLMFYTKGIKTGTFTPVELWDFSDLNNPQLLKSGLISYGGELITMNNCDFAYDPVTNRVYVISEDHYGDTFYPEDGGVDWIAGSNSLFYTSLGDGDTYPGESLFESHSWSKVFTLDKAQTGFSRNHNIGIVTDEYGWIVDPNKVPIIYSMSYLKTDFPNWNKTGKWPALHTYRLHGFVVPI